MSYQNLKAEMKRERITQENIAVFLGMSTNNLAMKLNGKVVMTVPEAVAIRNEFFPDATLDYLLKSV